MTKLQTEALVLSTSIVRKHFAEFMDSVVKTPKIIKRRNEQVIVISSDLLNYVIDHSIHVEKLEDGTFYGYFNELKGAYSYGESLGAFVNELSSAVHDYVYVYLNDFANMVSIPGTKEQALFILSLQDKEINEIRGLINDQMERIGKVL